MSHTAVWSASGFRGRAWACSVRHGSRSLRAWSVGSRERVVVSVWEEGGFRRGSWHRAWPGIVTASGQLVSTTIRGVAIPGGGTNVGRTQLRALRRVTTEV